MKSTGKLIIVGLTSLALTASVYAESPREQLNQMVQQLQKTPTDNALRERIITLAAEIKPAPAVPPEAKRPFVMAGTYQKEAKNPSDFALAITAYQDALKIAPWWGDAYYNLSVSLESAGRLAEAKDALLLYLLTKPRDAEEAQNRVYAIEAKSEMASRQATATAQQIEKANSVQTAAKPAGPDFSGCWQQRALAGTQHCDVSFERNGDGWIVRDAGKKPLTVVKAQGRQLWVEGELEGSWLTRHYELVLSENGQTIDLAYKDTQSSEQFDRMERASPGGRLTALNIYMRSTLQRK